MSDNRRSFGRQSESERGSARADEPPHSRLFVVCGKDVSENDIRNAFDKFGVIEEVWIVKDRQSGDSKGVAYIKFQRTSEAAKALEEMNGKSIGSSSRNIKVLVASSRDQGSKRGDGNDVEKCLRLFVMIPKSMTEAELTEEFEKYGTLDHATIIKDKTTWESKGFAYIKYYKFSNAALAYESVDKKYRAVFAEPKPTRQNESYDRHNNSNASSNSAMWPFDNSGPSYNRDNGQGGGGIAKLLVMASSMTNQDQIWRLFDIIPGLDFCRLTGGRGKSSNMYTVVYTNPNSAIYAMDKLHGFEYPPGQRLVVRADTESPNRGYNNDNNAGYGHNRGSSSNAVALVNAPGRSDIAHLAETIAQATSLIQQAGFQVNPNMLISGRDSGGLENHCNIPLPPVQPLADIDATVEQRCFIVCAPQPPPIQALRDVFCRFGNLIDVYTLSNRNCGYAKYAKSESAKKAMEVLHGAEVCGIRLKVLEAEEQRSYSDDDRRKRVRVDDRD